MRTRTYRTALLSTLLLAGCTPRETMPELTDRVFAVAAAQYEQLEGRLTDETLPRSAASDGKFIPSNIRWWCSGFYPGSLWYIYEYTGDKTFRELAEKNTFKLYPLKQKGTDHDLGFQMNCSFGNAYRITGEQKYLEPIHTSARVLAGRFSPVTGVIRSWDFVRKGRDWKYPVIIDNMMNLELLMWAADPTSRAITWWTTTPPTAASAGRRPCRASATNPPGRGGRPGRSTATR